MRAKHPTGNPALTTKADSPPYTTKTKSNEELLRKVITEARHFRGPASAILRNPKNGQGGRK
jgi:hypothetical protein